MGALTSTTGAGKQDGQEYAGRSLRIFDVSFANLDGLTWKPAITASYATDHASEPLFRFVSGDRGSSGGLSSGSSLFISAGTSVGRLYTFANADPVAASGTATYARTLGTEREQKLLGCKLHVYDFASVADADTFASGLSGILDYAVASSTKGCDATESSGTFTFSVTSGPSTNVRLLVWTNA